MVPSLLVVVQHSIMLPKFFLPWNHVEDLDHVRWAWLLWWLLSSWVVMWARAYAVCLPVSVEGCAHASLSCTMKWWTSNLRMVNIRRTQAHAEARAYRYSFAQGFREPDGLAENNSPSHKYEGKSKDSKGIQCQKPFTGWERVWCEWLWCCFH